MNSFIAGVSYVIEGFRLISKPRLRHFVFIPFVINIVFFITLFLVLRHYVSEFNLWIENFLPAWLHWLDVIVWLLFFASFYLIVIYTFVIFANLICAPFNSLLAEKVELYLTGNIQVKRTFFQNVQDIPHIIGRQLNILGYYLPRALLILILLFVPIIQTGIVAIWFLFHAWLMAITYLDYPTDNHRISIQEVRQWLNQRRWLAFGFGISVLVATMLPIVNFFVIPAAVAAATKLWLEEKSVTSTIIK